MCLIFAKYEAHGAYSAGGYKKSVSSDQGYVIEELLNPATTGLDCQINERELKYF